MRNTTQFFQKILDIIKILYKIILGGNSMSTNEVIKNIKERRSIRNYTEKQIPDNDLNTIIEAGIYAPNGGGDIENDIYFTIVQNKNVLNKLNSLAKEAAKQTDMEWLKELGNNKDFNCLYNAPTLIIISYKENSPCGIYDCSAVTQNMLLAAESLGLGSCWLYFPLQAFEKDRNGELLKELKIPQKYKPITSMIIGYKENNETNIPKRKTENIFYIK
jgi:nitroreductase